MITVPISFNGVLLGEWPAFNIHQATQVYENRRHIVVYCDVIVDGKSLRLCRWDNEKAFEPGGGVNMPKEWQALPAWNTYWETVEKQQLERRQAEEIERKAQESALARIEAALADIAEWRLYGVIDSQATADRLERILKGGNE